MWMRVAVIDNFMAVAQDFDNVSFGYMLHHFDALSPEV
jgi:hypothetical protein